MSQSCNTPVQGRGPELRYEFYFPSNDSSPSCNANFYQPTLYPSSSDMKTCRKIGYPLIGQPMCKFACKPSSQPPQWGNPIPSELYGDVLQMDGGDGMYYYEDPAAPKALSTLTYGNGNQPPHYRFTH